MCFVCTFNKRSNVLFREECYALTDHDLYEEEMKEALGNVIIKCSTFFTSDFQPIHTDQGLAYVITQYGSDEVILVRDDDYPDLELPEWCSSDLVPLGLRKAAALSGILHDDNIKKFGIKEGEDPNKYTPKLPYAAYLTSIGQRLSVAELVSMYLSKFLESTFFAELLSLLGHVFLYAIGGAIISPFFGIDPLGGLCGGATLGVAYWLIGLFSKYVLKQE